MSLIATSHITVVIGLGVTGVSVVRFLQQQRRAVLVMDSRELPPGLDQFTQEFPDVSVSLGAFDQNVLSEASEIIVSPGVSLKTPEIAHAIDSGVSVIGDIELFSRHVDKPVIAITGSNAKSTVTTLVGDMAAESGLNVAVGGNLGVPALDLLNGKDIDLFVLELSSFQLESTRGLKPLVATVLNISADHMDRYDSLMDYHRAKQRIHRNAQHVIVNRQDMLTHPPMTNTGSVNSFGSDKPDLKAFGLYQEGKRTYLMHGLQELISVDELRVKGKHNAINALAALAIGNAAGFDIEKMLAALKKFKGLAHRCEYVRTVDGVTYINDSKATNVGATLAAIEGFASSEKNILLIAGGEGKDADFSGLKPLVNQFVKCLILIGRDASVFHELLGQVVDCHFAQTLKDAVRIAKDQAQMDDIVLLSPACASFDMFSGFENRGDVFIEAVEELAA